MQADSLPAEPQENSKQEKLNAIYKLNYYIEHLFPLIPGPLTPPTLHIP